MEVSIDTAQPITEWVDFNLDPLKAIRCLAEAVNERISLLDGYNKSDLLIHISQFDSLDYDVILKIQRDITLIIGNFCDLDFDANHFSDYNTKDIPFPKKLAFSDFPGEVTHGFFDLPCRGSLISSFEKFYRSCRAILGKMVAIEHSGDVVSLKCKYFSNTYSIFNQSDSTWYSSMKKDSDNFQKTVIGNSNGDVSKKERYFLCDVVGRKSLIDILGICYSLSEAESFLENIEIYQSWKRITEELNTRIAPVHTTCSSVWSGYQTVVEFCTKHLSYDDSYYIIRSLEIARENKDGYSVQNGYNHFVYCLAQIDDEAVLVEGETVRQLFQTFFGKTSNYTSATTNVSENLSEFQKWMAGKSNPNYVEKEIRDCYYPWFVNGIAAYSGKLSNMCDYLTNMHFYYDDDDDFVLSYGMGYDTSEYKSFTGWREIYSAADPFKTRGFHYWGFINPLKFTNHLEVSYQTTAFWGKNAELRRDYLKILAVNQPRPELNCKLLFRYNVYPKYNSSKYLFYSFDNYRRPYKNSCEILTPSNLPEDLEIGWHKSKTIDWKPDLNLDFWFSSEHWIPEESQVIMQITGSSILGIEGEIHILLDYTESLRFK